MSFGFSAGDFLAFGRLIKDISSCIQDVGGSKDDYQELLRELECLQRALHHLDNLKVTRPSSINLDSIKYAALSCRRPLEQFLAKMRKFDRSLGMRRKGGVIKNTANKLRWGLGQKDEIRKLQNYLNIHVGTINILLAEHGLEKMDLASDEAAAHQLHIQDRLEDTRSMIEKIDSSFAAQTLVIQSVQNMLTRLSDMICGEFRTSLRSLGEMVAKVCVSTQQTYAVVLEIRNSLTGPDTRCSFFQAPLVIEDALGRKFPVPSEYDFDLLDAVIKHRFNTGPGSLDVEAGNYEYFKMKNSDDVLSKNSQLLPGMAITMAIIVSRQTSVDETCPKPECGSIQTVKSPGGGRICCQCHMWFSPTNKRPRSLQDLLSAISTQPNSPTSDDQPRYDGRPSKRVKLGPIDDSLEVVKNVRLSRSELSMDGNEQMDFPTYICPGTRWSARVR